MSAGCLVVRLVWARIQLHVRMQSLKPYCGSIGLPEVSKLKLAAAQSLLLPLTKCLSCPALPQAFDPEKSRTIVKGDSKCYVIAAASIIAKVGSRGQE